MLKPLSWVSLFVALNICVLDQITKYFASHWLEFAKPVHIITGFNLFLAHNHGAAFSFLGSETGWQRWFFITIAVSMCSLFVYLLCREKPLPTLERLALICILGGALGNVIDRIHLGYVIDFIQLYYQQWSWPVFNVADIMITVGAGLFILGIMKEKRI